MKIRRLNDNKVNELYKLRDTRRSIYKFQINFIANFNKRYVVANSILADYRNNFKSKSILEISTANYVSSIVTCWETFFRDLFVFVCDTDNTLKEKCILECQNKGYLDIIKQKNLTVSEYMSKQFNFQNFNDLLKSLNFLNGDNLNSIDEYLKLFLKNECIFASKTYILYWLQQIKKDSNFKNDIDNIIKTTLEVRHNIIHDANYQFKIDDDFMTKMEHCFFTIPQCIAMHFAIKYNCKMPLINIKNNRIKESSNITSENIPYIFTLDSLDSTYYVYDD